MTIQWQVGMVLTYQDRRYVLVHYDADDFWYLADEQDPNENYWNRWVTGLTAPIKYRFTSSTYALNEQWHFKLAEVPNRPTFEFGDDS